jgi:hypothetical protein
MLVLRWRYRQRNSMRMALNGACYQRSDTICRAGFFPALSGTSQRGRSDTRENTRSIISPPRLRVRRRRAYMLCFLRLSVISGGSGDCCFTFSQRTKWTASITGLQGKARCDLPFCSGRHTYNDDLIARVRRDNGHQKWWPSHARLSIAFCANSHSRWDPVTRAALPFSLARGRSCAQYRD